MATLSSMPNVGKVLEKNLNAIGVYTSQQLIQMGSKEAFFRIRIEVDDGACLHMLYGIQGAIENIRDTELSENTKQDLRAFYNSL
ncbi:TfoX/Sxy family DNA transformation protein [Oscillospiraceae bacterium MB08-C2-2]|nr:TfoX/Sxy family DNA transformation protein [Oscillospiraceae bacterium MB08-C2-2]